MKIQVQTIGAYRVASSDGEREVFLKVNGQEAWQNLSDCDIPPNVTALYYEFPHYDPNASAWDSVEPNRVYTYVPKGKSKLFGLAKEQPYFDPKLAEQKVSARQPRVKRKQPASIKEAAKPAAPKPKGKGANGASSPAAKKSKAQEKVRCYTHTHIHTRPWFVGTRRNWELIFALEVVPASTLMLIN